MFRGEHQLPMYSYINLLEVNIYTKKKLVSDATKVVGFEVNAESGKHTHMLTSHHQSAEHNIKMDNTSLEYVVQFRRLWTTATNHIQGLQARGNEEQVKFEKCLLTSSPEHYVFLSAIYNTKD
jgi:hypothetical protein